MYKLIAIYAIFILMLAIGATGEDNYYYSDGRQISLTPSSEKLVIGFTEDGYGNFSEFFLDYPELKDTVPPVHTIDDYYIFLWAADVHICPKLKGGG